MSARPSPERLRQRLRYDPETGTLWWRYCGDMPTRWNTRFAGQEAFTAHSAAYRRGQVDRYCCDAHQVIWTMVHGDWPSEIDHIDGDGRNNRIENLRIASRSENMRNAAIPNDNTSGRIGVSYHRRDKRWRAYTTRAGRYVHLGSFTTFEEAVAARTEAEQRLGFHPNHGRTNNQRRS